MIESAAGGIHGERLGARTRNAVARQDSGADRYGIATNGKDSLPNGRRVAGTAPARQVPARAAKSRHVSRETEHDQRTLSQLLPPNGGRNV